MELALDDPEICHDILGDCVSILVFVELALDGKYRIPGQCMPSVSILVFVELALDAQKVGDRALHHGHVSILVFVELALDVTAACVVGATAGEFQSLFSWNLLLMVEENARQGLALDVSILVFVELALDATVRAVQSPPAASFNPCFRGTCS